MRSKHSWIFIVMMGLVAIGVLQQFLSNPTSFLFPIIIVLIFVYFWKFPWRRGAGWKGNNPIERFREYRMQKQRLSKSTTGQVKKKVRTNHPFKVIDGKKKGANRKFH